MVRLFKGPDYVGNSINWWPFLTRRRPHIIPEQRRKCAIWIADVFWRQASLHSEDPDSCAHYLYWFGGISIFIII